jgi:hypothetical protein
MEEMMSIMLSAGEVLLMSLQERGVRFKSVSCVMCVLVISLDITTTVACYLIRESILNMNRPEYTACFKLLKCPIQVRTRLLEPNSDQIFPRNNQARDYQTAIVSCSSLAGDISGGGGADEGCQRG